MASFTPDPTQWEQMKSHVEQLVAKVTLQDGIITELTNQREMNLASANRVMGPSRPDSIKFKVDIPVFMGIDGPTDYHTWADTMQVLLAGANLGHTIVPGNMATDEQIGMARSYLWQGLAPDQRSLLGLTSTSTPEDIWATLRTLYLEQSTVNQQLLLQQYLEAKITSTDTATSYTTRLQGYVRRLSEYGVDISTEQLLAKLQLDFGKVPYYSVPVIAYKMSPLPTVLGLLQFLRAHETSTPRVAAGPAALTTRGNPPTCHGCKQPGHIIRDCPNGGNNGGRNGGNNGGRHGGHNGGHKGGNNGGKSNNSNGPYPKGSCKIHPWTTNHTAEQCYRHPQRGAANRAAAANQKDGAAMPRALVATSYSLDVSHTVLLDSGASEHMCPRHDVFVNMHAAPYTSVSVADKGACEVHGQGDVCFESTIDGVTTVHTLTNVLFVPSLSETLISVYDATTKGVLPHFDTNGGVKLCFGDQVLATGSAVGTKLYCMDVTLLPAAIPAVAAATTAPRALKVTADLNTWHYRLGHAGSETVRSVITDAGLLQGGGKVTTGVCEPCALGKAHRVSFATSTSATTRPLAKVHSDISGPYPTSIGGANYLVTFIDDYSNYVVAVPLAKKSDTLDAFTTYHKAAVTLHCAPLHVLQTDGGGEYVSDAFGAYVRDHGIRHQVTTAGTPQQNGVAERQNRTLFDMVRTLLQQSGLTAGFWAEAAVTAAYIRNMLPSRGAVNQSAPVTTWAGTTPEYGRLRVWGSPVYVHQQDTAKLAPRAVKGIFVGYPLTTKGYKVWIPAQHKMVVSRDVQFNEAAILHPLRPATSDWPTSPAIGLPAVTSDSLPVPANPDAAPHTVANLGLPVPEHRLPRTTRSGAVYNAQRYAPSANVAATEVPSASSTPPSEASTSAPIKAASVVVPKSIRAALKSPQRLKWQEAAHRELKALEDNGTFTLVPRPEDGATVIPVGWVFTVKQDDAGNVTNYKARLVARGNYQQPGQDYFVTESPVAALATVRVVLATAVAQGLPLRHIDVNTAFLNGTINETIYIEQPPGFANPSAPHAVGRLHKALYGLKQAPRQWYEALRTHLISQGFTVSAADPCLFIKGAGTPTFVALAAYVDDFTVVAITDALLDDFFIKLDARFSAKDLGRPSLLIGHTLTWMDDGSLRLSHRQHILDIAAQFRLSAMAGTKTPIVPGQTNDTNTTALYGKKDDYASLVGALLWIARTTRPDISQALGVLTRYTHAPTVTHWAMATRVVGYLLATIDVGIVYHPGPVSLIGYSDSDYAEDRDSRRSTTGYVFLINGSPVSWVSRLQSLTTHSSTEAEFVAMSAATNEGLWLNYVLDDLGLNSLDEPTPVTIYGDNESARAMLGAVGVKPKTKHIDVRYCSVKEHHLLGNINVVPVASADNKADMFTKALPASSFIKAVGMLGMR